MTNVLLTVAFVLMTSMFLLPFILVVIVSFSTESSIAEKGYTFFPSGWTLTAYEEIFRNENIWRSLSNSVMITVGGTLLALFLILTMGYALSCRDFRLKKLYTAIIVIPMFFGGGLAASYVVNTQLFHLRNTLLALILPCACSSWYIFIAKKYFSQTIPQSIIEASRLDGSSEFQTFTKVVLPMSGPLIAALGIFEAFAYWNSWYYASLYISNDRTDLYPLQYMLIRMQESMESAIRLEENMSGSVASYLPADSLRMALLVIIVLPVFLLYPIVQRSCRNGITQGALKE